MKWRPGPQPTGQVLVGFINEEIIDTVIQKLDLSLVEYSNNDRILGIKLPKYLTEELAYFLGFHTGDGYMKVTRRKTAVDYRLQYEGHGINELKFYIDYLQPLIKILFSKDSKVRKTKAGGVFIGFRSKAILTFLNTCCGICQSPKKEIKVPNIIKFSNLHIKACFIRGLADTDFSLSFKKNGKYPVINHGTYSETLHKSVRNLLDDLGIGYFAATYQRELKGTQLTTHHIDINGKKRLRQWMDQIGFSSYNSITRYLVWRHTGSLAPKTNINDRILILEKVGMKNIPGAPSTRFESTNNIGNHIISGDLMVSSRKG